MRNRAQDGAFSHYPTYTCRRFSSRLPVWLTAGIRRGARNAPWPPMRLPRPWITPGARPPQRHEDCDGFNSLEHDAPVAIWAVATVSRFLSARLTATEYRDSPGSFNSLNPRPCVDDGGNERRVPSASFAGCPIATDRRPKLE